MSNEVMKKEMMEAIQAGERALFSLRASEGKLDSAKNWGIFDMLGGGLISGLVKHSNLEEASGYLEDAKRNILLFQKELKDVQEVVELKIEIDGFLSFADFFFDGIVADYLVQSKISEARSQVQDAAIRVERLLQELRTQYEML